MAVTKPKGKTTGLLSKGGLNKALKMIKMIQARCRVCNPQGQGPRGWWETCPHDPYFHFEEIPQDPVPTEQEDGSFTLAPPADKKFKKVPNWKQIADDPKVASGRMITIQLERGSKFPEDFGYAPICDYYNCWEPANPKYMIHTIVEHEGVQTVVGKYHKRDEAAIMKLRLEGQPIYLGLDQDMKRRRTQLQQVNLDE